MAKLNIIDYGIASHSIEEKREFLYNLDYQLKYIHEHDGYVRNMDPRNIYVDDSNNFPYFEDFYSISKSGFENPNEIKKVNLLWLADLAFCLYLPDYHLENGLFSLEVLNSNFEQIKTYFPAKDVDYYRNIFSDIHDISYFSDYFQKTDSDNSKVAANAIQYIKSTPAGRAMALKDDESGLVNYVFITCVVFALVILALGVCFYILN